MKQNSPRLSLYAVLCVASVVLILGYLCYKNVLITLGVWNNASRMQIFLKVDATESDKKQLTEAIQKNSKVTQVVFTDRKKSVEAFQNSLKHDVNELLSRDELMDLLPESAEVELSSELSLDEREAIYEQISRDIIGLAAVDEVVNNAHWLKKFSRIDSFVRAAGQIVFLLILVLMSYLMSLMLRVYIDESRSEIEVYTLLGATRWSIYRLFMQELLKLLILSQVFAIALSLLSFKLIKTWLSSAGLAPQILAQLRYMGTFEIVLFMTLLLTAIVGHAFLTVRKSLNQLNQLAHD